MIVFFLVGFGVPWLGWTTLAVSGLDRSTAPAVALFYTGDFMTVAGFLATAVAAGALGFRSILRRFFQIGAPVRWMLFAVFLPLTWEVGQTLTYGLATGGVGRIDPAALALYLSPGVLLALTTGPLGEEAGWRGFLLPRLLDRFSPLRASLFIGLIWSAWHLPLYWDSVFASVSLTLRFTVLTVCASVLMTVLWAFTRASVFWAVIFHWTLNISGRVTDGLFPDVHVPDDATRWLESGFMILVTLLTVGWVGRERLAEGLAEAMGTLGAESVEDDGRDDRDGRKGA